MPVNKFIRYNTANSYYEYDTSVAQDGSGPWLLLPLGSGVATGLKFVRDDGTLAVPAGTPTTDASLLTSGTLADARLSSNVPLKNGTNSFTGANDFSKTTQLITEFNSSHADGGYNDIKRSGTSKVKLGTYKGIITTGSVDDALLNATSKLTLRAASGDIDLDPSTSIVSLLGGRLKFPATQNASTDANTLDDYEEGTYTPTINAPSGSGQTYGTREAKYLKIGKWVFCIFNIALASKGTLAGALNIGGLPFAVDTTAGSLGTCCISLFVNLVTNWIWLGGYGAASQINMTGIQAAGTTYVAPTAADFGATTQLVGSIYYTTSA